MFPDPPGPPPLFGSLGGSVLGASGGIGAGASLTSVPSLQPIARVIKKPARTEKLHNALKRIDNLRRVEAKEDGVHPRVFRLIRASETAHTPDPTIPQRLFLYFRRRKFKEPLPLRFAVQPNSCSIRLSRKAAEQGGPRWRRRSVLDPQLAVLALISPYRLISLR
jgi:hypothetical protein